jgi:hypothetical protein
VTEIRCYRIRMREKNLYLAKDIDALSGRTYVWWTKKSGACKWKTEEDVTNFVMQLHSAGHHNDLIMDMELEIGIS